MEIEKVGSVHILTLPSGKMCYDFTTVPPQFPHEDALLELYRLATEPRDILINFREVTGLGTYALGLLMEGHEIITATGKQLAFCQLHPAVEKFIRTYAPNTSFRIYSAEEAAIYYMTHR